MVATNLAEAGGEGDGLLGGGQLGGVGVPRRHGADWEETRRRAAGAGGKGGGGAAAVGRDGWRRIGEASTGRGESSGGGDEERVREEEAHARSHVGVPCLAPALAATRQGIAARDERRRTNPTQNQNQSGPTQNQSTPNYKTLV